IMTRSAQLQASSLRPQNVVQIENLRPAGRNLPFALSTDATNKENRKLSPIAVRFYNVNGAGITDGLIDFCEAADGTSGGICELLATSLEKANQGLEILPGGQTATLDFVNVYDRALAYLGKWFDFENSPFKRLAELDLRKGAPS
ncbi:hypothetical protein HPB47_008760, partial [Ixodes persulcatus]